jgi:hypothetical protein
MVNLVTRLDAVADRIEGAWEQLAPLLDEARRMRFPTAASDGDNTDG